MNTYRVGFVGFGFIGKVHAYGYLNLPLFYDPLPLQARIVSICTSRLETATKGCWQVGAEVATTDYRAITENPEIDIVHICTPNTLHKEALLSAMRHQKAIYCDKPLVTSMAEAEEIRAALADYRGIAQMTFQNRFFPATLRAKQLVDEGFLGPVLEFRAAYLHSGSADPTAPLKWKLSGQYGGGVIADLGSHVFDLLHSLVGDFGEVLAVTQVAYPDRPSAENPAVRVPVDAEDAVRVLVRTEDGATGFLEASKIATGAEDELRFEIHGSHGALRFNTMDPHVLEVYDRRTSDQPVGGFRGWTRVDAGQRYPKPASGFPSPKNSIGWMRSHMACLANFLMGVAEHRPVQPDLAQGITVQRVIEATRESASTGRWTPV